MKHDLGIKVKKMNAAVEFRNITKTFGNVVANDHISFEIHKGEILALLGENGSGKTTLMNMLSGIYFPDFGEIYVNGKKATIQSPKDALALGIGMIHQHFKLVDVMTATENIVLGLNEPGKFDLKKAAAKIQEICDRYGFELNLNQKIYTMSVSQKQTVEIVKVLYRQADFLILDEPTAVLTPQETEKLFRILRNMKKDGKAIIIITHKLNEVKEISDRVVVMRSGKFISSLNTADVSIQEMTNQMVGHQFELHVNRTVPKDPQPRIRVQGLTVRSEEGVTKLNDISFTAFSNEILGIAGISGSGQKELLEAISGLQKVEQGSIRFLDGERESELVGKNPLEIENLGVTLSFVPEDRLGMGLVGNMDLSGNMMLRSFRKGGPFFAERKGPRSLAAKVVRELGVVTPNLETPVRQLSGGNVQKVLVGREISSTPKVLLTAYAVRGLDINSSYTIYELLEKQKQKGVSVVYVGEDLDTLLALCDRILVLADGKLMGAVDARKISKNDVGLLMMGQNIETGKLLDPNRPYSGEQSEGTDSEVTHE